MYKGTAHVVLGSGMTIAGATFCLHFTNLPYFKTLGIPLAIGMVGCGRGGIDVLAPRPLRWQRGSARHSNQADRNGFAGWRKVWRSRRPLARPDSGDDDRDRTCRPCSPCPDTAPTKTTATICPPIYPRTRVTRPRIGTSRRRGMNPEVLMIESDHDLRKLRGLLGHRQDRQDDLPGAGNRSRASHHPARGNAD